MISSAINLLLAWPEKSSVNWPMVLVVRVCGVNGSEYFQTIRKLFVLLVVLLSYSFSSYADNENLKAQYDSEIQDVTNTLKNPKQMSGFERYLLSFTVGTYGQDEQISENRRVAQLLMVYDEQKKIARKNGESTVDLSMPYKANDLLAKLGIALIKKKMAMSCDDCATKEDSRKYREAVDFYFSILNVQDVHAGFSGLPFSGMMAVHFHDPQFQKSAVTFNSKLNEIIGNFNSQSDYTTKNNIWDLALQSTGGNSEKALTLLGLLISRDVLITRYLRYLKSANAEFVDAVAMVPVSVRLITELNQKNSKSKQDTFSFPDLYKSNDDRNYYFWSAALASHLAVKNGHSEKHVRRIALQFPKMYKILRYLEKKGFLQNQEWQDRFLSDSMTSLHLTGRGTKLGFAVNKENSETDTEKFLKSFHISDDSDLIKRDWLRSLLENPSPANKVQVLFYDFSRSRVGFSHLKLLIDGKAYEIHRFKNSQGTYLRVSDIAQSLLDAKPGSLPSGILEFSANENQKREIVAFMEASSAASMRYSFFNKVFDANAYNCAGIIFDALKMAGVKVGRLKPYDGMAFQVFNRLVKNIPGSRLIGKSGGILENIVAPNISRASFLGSTQKVNRDFKDLVGSEFLKAEQGLTESTPLFANFRRIVGLFFSEYSNYGKLPAQYLPKNAQTLSVPTILIPKDKMTVNENELSQSKMESIVRVQLDGKEYVRIFIHPLETDRYAKALTFGRPDPIKWIGTPSSSGRTLFVTDSEFNSPVFTVKTSIHMRTGGADRVVSDEKVGRAVPINDILENAQAKSGNILPSGKTWDFFREPVSTLLVENPELGGNIFRSIDSDFSSHIHIPILALTASRDASDMWIEELFRYSGYKSKKEFLWNDYVKPLIELQALFSLQFGVTTEFHQQNVLVKIDPKTRRIVGFQLRDLDSFWVDHSLRKKALGMTSTYESDENFEKYAYLLKYGKSQKNQYRSYVDILRTRSIEWIAKYFVSSDDLSSVLKKADVYYGEVFNKQFPEFAVENTKDLSVAWDKLHSSVTTQEVQREYKKFEDFDAEKYKDTKLFSLIKTAQDAYSEYTVKKRSSSIPQSCLVFYKKAL